MKSGKLALAGTLVAAVVLGSLAAAVAQQRSQPRNGLAPSPTGAYLAGRYAN